MKFAIYNLKARVGSEIYLSEVITDKGYHVDLNGSWFQTKWRDHFRLFQVRFSSQWSGIFLHGENSS